MDSILTPEEQSILIAKFKNMELGNIEKFYQQLPTHLNIKNTYYTRTLYHLLTNDTKFSRDFKENKKSECGWDDMGKRNLSMNEKETSDILKLISNIIDDSIPHGEVEDIETNQQTTLEFDTVDGFSSCIPAALSQVSNIFYYCLDVIFI